MKLPKVQLGLTRRAGVSSRRNTGTRGCRSLWEGVIPQAEKLVCAPVLCGECCGVESDILGMSIFLGCFYDPRCSLV